MHCTPTSIGALAFYAEILGLLLPLLTYFCSAAFPPINTGATSPRIAKNKRFIYTSHSHTLPGGLTH